MVRGKKCREADKKEMKSFKQHITEINWRGEKEFPFRKTTGAPGRGGRGGSTENVDGYRATIKYHSKEFDVGIIGTIPPVDVVPFKDEKRAKYWIKKEVADHKKRGDKVHSVKIKKSW